MNFKEILNQEKSNSLRDYDNKQSEIDLRKFASLNKNHFEIDKEYKDNLFDKILNNKIEGNLNDKIKFSNSNYKFHLKK